MKKLIYLFISVAMLCVACGGEKTVEKPQKKQKRDSSTICIGVMPTIDCLPYYIAQERGMFQRDSLKVMLIPFNAQMDIDTALVGGSVAGAFTDLVRTEKLKTQGVKLHYLTSTEAQWQLITNKQARLSNMKQFGDKMIAMTRYSATDFLTEKALNGVQTTADVFRVQINDVNVRREMLVNNEIDAVWFMEPYATAAILAGHKSIYTQKLEEEKLGVLALRKSFADAADNAQKIELLRKIYSAACDSINKNGFAAYSDVIAKHCHVADTVAAKLEKHIFVHAEAPTEDNINKAKTFLK